MRNKLVRVSAASGPVIVASASLRELVERAGGAARSACEEFFFAEHHNPHAKRAYESAVRRFLARAEGEGPPPHTQAPAHLGAGDVSV